MGHTIGTLASALDAFLTSHLAGMDSEVRTSALADMLVNWASVLATSHSWPWLGRWPQNMSKVVGNGCNELLPPDDLMPGRQPERTRMRKPALLLHDSAKSHRFLLTAG